MSVFQIILRVIGENLNDEKGLAVITAREESFEKAGFNIEGAFDCARENYEKGENNDYEDLQREMELYLEGLWLKIESKMRNKSLILFRDKNGLATGECDKLCGVDGCYALIDIQSKVKSRVKEQAGDQYYDVLEQAGDALSAALNGAAASKRVIVRKSSILTPWDDEFDRKALKDLEAIEIAHELSRDLRKIDCAVKRSKIGL